MVQKLVTLCAMCLGKGVETAAVARYWDGYDVEWLACKRHLEDVEAAGWMHEMLEGESEVGG